MKYLEWFMNIFGEVMDIYDLKAEVLSDDMIALAGNGYLLEFLFHRDDVFLLYIRKSADGTLVKWDLEYNFSKSICDGDRNGIVPNSKTVMDRIHNILIIIANALENHWDDLLRGELGWKDDPARMVFPLACLPLSKKEIVCAKRYI